MDTRLMTTEDKVALVFAIVMFLVTFTLFILVATGVYDAFESWLARRPARLRGRRRIVDRRVSAAMRDMDNAAKGRPSNYSGWR